MAPNENHQAPCGPSSRWAETNADQRQSDFPAGRKSCRPPEPIVDADQNALQRFFDKHARRKLRRAFEKNNLDEERIRTLLDEAERLKIPLDGPALEFALRRTIERLARYLAENPTTLPLLENLNTAVTLARSIPFPVDLWEAQHVFYDISCALYPRMREEMERGDAAAEAWTARFQLLSENLSVRLD